ncbi:MAG TPA: four helix bundle protein [Pyrinomonadaceae bacterium]|jgi:four helix bundle protein|nr:four helix bundle protein [Pyrinomonadaceae bacterium]
MAKVKKFEDIQSWKKGRSLTKEIYQATLTGSFAKDFGLRDQMRRAAVSILSNIAEGFERGGDKEFLHFLAIAKGSAGELRAQLYVALDQDYLSLERFDLLTREAIEISQLISGFMKYLKQSGLRGSTLR